VPPMLDFLSQFRPAGAPGAGRAAVPADRQRDRESELGPVLAALDAPGARCADLVAAAQRDAEQIVAAARSEADGIVAAARRRAADLVGELVQQAVSSVETEAASIVAAGAADAAAVRERAQRRLPALTAHAVALVWDVGEKGGST
jgi:vacuolar-type H+-ATPase subunit H